MLSLYSCSNSDNITDSTGKRQPGLPHALIAEFGGDTLFALLTVHYGDDSGPLQTLQQIQTVQAFFADSNSLFNPTSASYNGTPLHNVERGESHPGQFWPAADVPVLNGLTPSVSWNVTDYLGANLSQTVLIAPSFGTMTSMNLMDTVSKQSGFAIVYDNIVGEDSLLVIMSYSEALTDAYVHPDSVSGAGIMTMLVPDNGTVTIPSSAMSGFTPNRVFNLSVTRYKYSTFSHVGHTIGHASSYTRSTSVYLKP